MENITEPCSNYGIGLIMDQPQWVKYIFGTITMALTVFAFVANVLTVTVITANKTLNIPSNHVLVSFALNDIAMSTFSMPFAIWINFFGPSTLTCRVSLILL